MTAEAQVVRWRKTWIRKHLVRGFDERSNATQETMAAQPGISPGLCFPKTRIRHRAAVDRRPQPGWFEPGGGGPKNGNNTIDRRPAGERKAVAKRQQPQQIRESDWLQNPIPTASYGISRQLICRSTSCNLTTLISTTAPNRREAATWRFPRVSN